MGTLAALERLERPRWQLTPQCQFVTTLTVMVVHLGHHAFHFHLSDRLRQNIGELRGGLHELGKVHATGDTIIAIILPAL